MRSGPFDHAARLRRFARAIEPDPVVADGFVLAVLQEATRRADFEGLVAGVLRAARASRDQRVRPMRVASVRDPVKALHGLDPDQAEVLALVVVEGLTHTAAARILRLSPEGLVNRLTEARRAYSRALDNHRPVSLRLVK